MSFSDIKTDPELLALIEKARTYKMTPEEVFEQRVSFVFGMLSSRSKLTRDDVRRHLINMNGVPATPPPHTGQGGAS